MCCAPKTREKKPIGFVIFFPNYFVAKRRPDVVLLYSVASHRSREWITCILWEGTTTLLREIAPRKKLSHRLFKLKLKVGWGLNSSPHPQFTSEAFRGAAARY